MKLIEKIYKKLYHPERRFMLEGKKISDILLSLLICRKELYEFVKLHANAIQGRVLDFGCGEKPYVSLFSCDEYIGVDIETSGHSEERNNYVDVYYKDNKLPFSDEYFDSAISTQVFEHIYDIDELILEIKRVLKPRGQMLLTVPLTAPEHEIPYDFFRYTTYGITKKLEQHGFKVEVCEKLGTYKSAIRYLNISRAIENYCIKKTFWRAVYAFFVMVWNNMIFMMGDCLPQKENSFSLNIGVLASKN